MNKQALIVSLIKKIGQGLEEAPIPGKAPINMPTVEIGGDLEEAPGVVRIGPGGIAPGTQAPPSANALRNIKVMQQELVGLARDVISQINMGGQGRTPTEAVGRNFFADFMQKNYLDKSEAASVMTAMRNIASAKGGLAVDGQWGPQTNAALHSAAAYGLALLQLAGDFHFQPTTYTVENYSAFNSEIPAQHTDFSLTQKLDAAPDIVKQLVAIRKLFGEVKTHILEKPAYRAYIEGDQPLHTYNRTGTTSTLDPKTVDSLSNQFNTRLRVSLKTPNGGWMNQPITVNDLTSLEALKKWQQAHAPQAPLPTILNSLKSALDVMDGSHPISSDQPVQPTPQPQQPQPTHRQHNRRRGQ